MRVLIGHREAVQRRFWSPLGGDGAAGAVRQSIDLDRATCVGRTPLFMAAEAGSLHIVQLLADHGACTTTPEHQSQRRPREPGVSILEAVHFD